VIKKQKNDHHCNCSGSKHQPEKGFHRGKKQTTLDFSQSGELDISRTVRHFGLPDGARLYERHSEIVQPGGVVAADSTDDPGAVPSPLP
jgi:hypothetical protein